MKLLITIQHAPYTSRFGRDGLDVALLGLAFEHAVALLFLDEGVWQLACGQAPAKVGIKDPSGVWRSLVMHGIARVQVSARAITERGLTPESLLLPVDLLDDREVAHFMAEHDAILSF